MPDNSVILLVEDQENDIQLIRRAFDKAQLPNPLQVVRNGDEAVAYLAGQKQFSNRVEFPLPKLVLLDLKMPGLDGFEVLKWIRSQPGLKSLIVVVLTSSDHIQDVNQAYSLGANSFMAKPMDFENIVELSRLLRDYWIMANRCPETFREPRFKNPRNDRGEQAPN
jgi:CheY-like chemotaxis protein